MTNSTRLLIAVGLGIFITIGEAWILFHSLVESKPYKIVDPSGVFHSTAYYGLPVSLILSWIAAYFMRTRIVSYLLSLIPIVVFPLFVWIFYQALFLFLGLDLFAGSGDFTNRQLELEFAQDVIQALMMGLFGGLISVAISAIVMRPVHPSKYTLDELVEKITDENRPRESYWK